MDKKFYTVVTEYPAFDADFNEIGREYRAWSFFSSVVAINALDDQSFPTILTKTATAYRGDIVTERLV